MIYNPTDADFLSSIISGSLGYFLGQDTFVEGTLTQFSLIVFAKNVSSITNNFDRPDNELFQEIDLWLFIGSLVWSLSKEYATNETPSYKKKEIYYKSLYSPASLILSRLLTKDVVFN